MDKVVWITLTPTFVKAAPFSIIVGHNMREENPNDSDGLYEHITVLKGTPHQNTVIEFEDIEILPDLECPIVDENESTYLVRAPFTPTEESKKYLKHPYSFELNGELFLRIDKAWAHVPTDELRNAFPKK